MNPFTPKEWQFEFQQRGSHPLLMANLWCQALHSHYPKEIDLDVKGLDYLMTSENKGYYRKGQREAVLEKFNEKLRNDPEYLQYIFNKTTKAVEELASFMAKDSRDWKTFVEKSLCVIPWFYIPWYITEYNFLSDKVAKGLEKYKVEIEKLTDLNNAAMILMFPDKQMGFQEEQEILYALVEKAKKGETVDPKEYLEKFSWMKTFILVPSEPLNEEGLDQKIQKAIAEKSDETYKLQQERKNEDRKIVAKIEKIFATDNQLNQDIRNARHLGWLLTWSVETAMKAFAAGIPWYKEIAKTIGLKYEDWVYLTIAEVAESLEKKESVVSQDEIEQRKQANILYMIDGKAEVFSGDDAKKIIASLNQEEASGVNMDVKEIVGKPASPGKVRGRVKICPTAKDSNSLEDGDILITSMTTPDYVPAMKKAGAIVTDEGGLLCHAAIISRELGKPCVIATKIATKILKDGDMIEVDADKGIIILLK